MGGSLISKTKPIKEDGGVGIASPTSSIKFSPELLKSLEIEHTKSSLPQVPTTIRLPQWDTAPKLTEQQLERNVQFKQEALEFQAKEEDRELQRKQEQNLVERAEQVLARSNLVLSTAAKSSRGRSLDCHQEARNLVDAKDLSVDVALERFWEFKQSLSAVGKQ
jgi:hypothetical protein